MPVSRPTHSQRNSKQNLRIGLSLEAADGHCRQHIERGEYPCIIEDPHEPICTNNDVGVDSSSAQPVRHRHLLFSDANRRLSATIISGGGAHRYTPHRSPSMTGVSGPIMPRTNR